MSLAWLPVAAGEVRTDSEAHMLYAAWWTALYLAGLLRVVCPVGDGSGTTGVGIFDASIDETAAIMRQDPGVKAGLFTYELHATQTFPDSTLSPVSPTA